MKALQIFVWLTFLVLAAGCIQLGDQSPSQPRPQTRSTDLTVQAGQAFDRGDFAAAAALYRRYLEQNPQSPRRETVLALAGLSSEHSGQFLSSVNYYQALIDQYPQSAYAGKVLTRIPELLLLAGRPDEALAKSEALSRTQTDSTTRAALKLSSGRALYTLGRFQPALVSFIEAMTGATAATRNEAQRGLEASLYNLNADELNNVFRQYGQNYPGPEAFWHLIRLAAVSGDSVALAERAAYFRSYFPTHPWLGALTALETEPSSQSAQVSGAQYDPKPAASTVALTQKPFLAGDGVPQSFGPIQEGMVKVGAILPLTVDQSSRFAVDILAGLKLALSLLPNKVTVIPLDTAGDPAQAIRLVNESASDPTMVVLVGPLTSRESLAAAQTAQLAGIPLIAISQRLGLNSGRPMVFRLFLTPKHQAEAVARYAVKVNGISRLGIMYPDDSYGQAMLGFYRSEIERLGASLSAAASYDPVSNDFSAAITSLTGGEFIRRADITYQAPVKFEALFIPDSPASISQILPRLAFYDVTKMLFLGTPLWLTDDLATNTGHYLTDSLIPDSYNSLSQRNEAVEFRTLYERANGRPPNQFAAYGYDAGIAIVTALNRGASSRAQIIQALSTFGPFPGATGPFSFDQDGEYTIEPMMLTIKNKKFVIVAEPASSR
ncbi:MAG: penicillin-binding protein activator [Deltaproteobacteria bacterium]|jgi:ABC-type branched-subunit amino acid transport system substrate-binding protein|nr:penicillin-binding protein activator [Deltaproteobacteria bacterium]